MARYRVTAELYPDEYGDPEIPRASVVSIEVDSYAPIAAIMAAAEVIQGTPVDPEPGPRRANMGFVPRPE